MTRWGWAVGLFLCATILLISAPQDRAVRERLARHRTLGKAFYENPTTQIQAVEEFRQALALDPASIPERLNYGLALLRAGRSQEAVAELEKVQKADPKLPHTWFNLGIEFKKQGEPEKAIAQLEQMAKLVPDEPITQYNLGVLYKLQGRTDEANAKFALTAKLDPNLAAPHFQLFNAYRQTGRREEAQRELQAFQEIKKQQEATSTSEDVEWSFYSEIYEAIEPGATAAAAPVTARFTEAPLPGKFDAASTELFVFDADNDGVPDLMSVSPSSGLQLYRKGLGPAVPIRGDFSAPLTAAAGDFNNDGLIDLCVLTTERPVLLRNSDGGVFQRHAAALPADRFRTALWIDYDHDYDLDLVLVGNRTVLLRNQGEAGFVDRSADIPFTQALATGAVTFRLVPDTKAHDLLISYADRPAVLYRDRLGGRYEAEATSIPPNAAYFTVADVNADSYFDLHYLSATGTMQVLNRSGRLGTPAAFGDAPSGSFAFGDWDNRGALDAVVATGKVWRNQGSGQFSMAAAPALPAFTRAVTADFDSDGRPDFAALKSDGTLAVFRNQTVTKNLPFRVRLEGIKNLKLAPGTEVEVKSGLLYQKQIYAGLPLVFGMGSYRTLDTVRITWPNGLIQNEIKAPVSKPMSVKEAQRLSGSCPVIWTWNGHEFEYITDVLGVAPLGAAAGDGKYFPVDHDEYIWISGDSLRERNGELEVRISEELSEVSYLDQVQLIAVDHPASLEIFHNDKWKGPPFPEFRLFGSATRRYPQAALEDNGKDVTELIRARDRRYPNGFRHDYSGVAERHSLTLDFGKAPQDKPAVLILSGWVDWADGSTFLAQAQVSPAGLVPPQLQVKDGKGNWVTVLEDMGMPAGKPKTIAVDLSGKFLSESREVRIVTNLCVFWDEIFLIENAATPEHRLTHLAAARTDLHFRGFSETLIHPQRKQPEQFFYNRPAATSLWNPTPGMYTRYGPVTELLRDVDDRMVIMGSGDEVTLHFRAAELPALPNGWRRDYLLKVDGWAKDRDANTAHSQTVEPLPFHGMSQYPYAPGESYPDNEHTRVYRREYNKRPGLRLLRPLVEQPKRLP